MMVILRVGGRGHHLFFAKHFRYPPFALCIHRESEENETYMKALQRTPYILLEGPRMVQSGTLH